MAQMTKTLDRPESAYARLVALAAFACCIVALVSGLIPQAEMALLGGNVVIGNALAKGLLLVCLLIISFLNPKLKINEPFLVWWLLLVLFLIFEIGFLSLASDIPLWNVLGAYNGDYLLPLIGVPFFLFGGNISEKTTIRVITLIFLACAIIGLAQHLTNEPLLYTESADGNFVVSSWNFAGSTRAFSLFSSPLEYGIFCSFCGALGVALLKHHRASGLLLLAASGFACYTTLTRLCYLLFACACVYALILTFGKKPRRGLWQPALFFVLGIATILAGLNSLAQGNPSGLQDVSSLLDRIEEWTYGYQLLGQASLSHQLFGMGITQNAKFTDMPMLIDNAPLALSLHIGLIGLILFTIYFVSVWLYLRREAVAKQQPFIIAAASLWSTLLCAGTFNIIFSSFGAVFVLAVLCRTERK
jgi:lipid-A-disaccharide synthase-like uncharacterized protein